jgi:hypothetical protein
MSKRILLVTAGLLLGIQLIRPHPNASTEPAGKDDFIVRYQPPPEVANVLRQACYDCHSNHTRYPWYAQVQPVGWWLAHHISEGKRELNFSVFGAYAAVRQAKKIDHMSDQVTNRSMPMPSYTWIHRDARLTDEQIRVFSEWCDSLHDQIAQRPLTLESGG